MPSRRPHKMTGPPALFRGKVRAPVSITLTKAHHAKVNAAMQRLGLTRADVIALLIDQYADEVALPPDRGDLDSTPERASRRR